MQYAYSLMPSVRAAIETTLSPQRLSRYLPAANGDASHAFRLYLWNIRLCEAFYLPCHFGEVAIRNGLHEALKAKFGREDWHLDRKFLRLLPARLSSELSNVVQRAQADHGSSANVHHVISGLSFGFWNNLLSSSYHHLLWHTGVHAAFPLAPASETRQTLHTRVQRFRNWRNRIFHHNAIFDKRPSAELQNIDALVGWRCRETQLLMSSESLVSRTINARPRV